MRKLLLIAITILPILMGYSLYLFDLNWQLENLAAFVVFIPLYYLLLTAIMLVSRSVKFSLFSFCAGIISAVTFGAIPMNNSQQECRPDAVSVLQYNTYYDNNQIGVFIDFAREQRPDILVLQEVSPIHGEQLKLLGDLYPYQYGGQRRVGYPSGQMILSRSPMYGMNTVTSISGHNIIRVVWRASEDKDLFLIAAHPPSPRTKALWLQRNEVIEDVRTMAEASPLETVLVVGDFNLASTTSRFNNMLPGFESWPVASWPVFIKRWTLPAKPVIAIDHFWIRNARSDDQTICSRERIRHINGSDHAPIETRFNP